MGVTVCEYLFYLFLFIIQTHSAEAGWRHCHYYKIMQQEKTILNEDKMYFILILITNGNVGDKIIYD